MVEGSFGIAIIPLCTSTYSVGYPTYSVLRSTEYSNASSAYHSGHLRTYGGLCPEAPEDSLQLPDLGLSFLFRRVSGVFIFRVSVGMVITSNDSMSPVKDAT